MIDLFRNQLYSLQSMLVELRSNCLIAFEGIVKKVKALQQGKGKIGALLTDLQMMRRNLQLILNRNEHLQTKFRQKDRQVNELKDELQCRKRQLELKVSMMKKKYDKCSQELKFFRFMGESRSNKKSTAKQQGEEQQIIRGKMIYELKDVHSVGLTSERNENSQWKPVNEFDLDTRMRKDFNLASEPFTYHSHKKDVTGLPNEEQLGIKKKRSKSSKGNREGRQISKKKSEQLALLVEQQCKTVQVKECYFCTDLL